MTPWTCISLWIRKTAIFPSLLNFGGVWVCFSTSSWISARALSNRTLPKISFGPFATSSASHAEITSNLAVLLAVFCQGRGSIYGTRRLTSIKQRNSIIDRLLGMGFEDLRHVWEWRLPFEGVAEIAMRTHGAKKAARRGNRWVQGLTDLVC